MTKLTAKKLFDGFYIVEEKGSKIGTLKATGDSFEMFDNRTSTKTTFDSLSSFNVISNTTKEYVNDTVYGYSCNTEQAHNISLQDIVPVYTKTAVSKQYFAAGYYGILFPMGWRPSFCPRLKTLESYEFIGPFKNETDMQLAIRKKG